MPRVYKTPIRSRTFELVARLFREEFTLTTARYDDERNREQSYRSLRCFALAFADAFADSNSQFDRDRFLRACGLE